MNKKAVSVFITAYNFENYISQAIESVLAQKFQDFEICISDDGSTDKTPEILKEYASKYPDRIKIALLEKNYGCISTSINANNCLALCTGKYITWLDGDDLMMPDRIEEQFNYLERNPDFIAVSHWCEAFESDSGKIIGNIHEHLNVLDRSTETLIKRGNSIPPTLMFRNVWSVKFDRSLKKMPDWLFYIELSRLGKIWHQNQFLTKYRRHSSNLTNGKMYEDLYITISILESKYPEYIPFTTVFRVELFLNTCSELIRKKEYRTAMKILFCSLRMRPLYVAWKILFKVLWK